MTPLALRVSLLLVYALYLLLLNQPSINCKRILLVPFLNTSHTIILHAVATRLVERGHSIAVLWAREFQQDDITGHANYTLIEFSIRIKSNELDETYRTLQDAFANQQNESLSAVGWLESMPTVGNIFKTARKKHRFNEVMSGVANAMCNSVLSDERLMTRLRDQFDMAFVDDYYLSHCLYLIPHSLGIPFVSIGESASWWDMCLPHLPVTLISTGQSTRSFFDRLPELVMIIARSTIFLIHDLQFYSEENFKVANVSSLSEYLSLPSHSSLFLFLWDSLMTGLVLPKLPHVKFIGGVTARPAKELKSGLKEWADKATDGFVVCSFGSFLVSPTELMLEKLFYLFSKLQPIPVILKLSRKLLSNRLNSQVPENVKMMDWLPQNDLLGHPNARLFITHAGTNGYGEALYHGIPLLAFPLIFLQKFMAGKIETLGYGREGSLFTMNGSELVTLAKEVLNDKRFRQQVGRVSKIMTSRKHPTEVSADAVEHVLEFGADHLLPKGPLMLNFLQFYMLDLLILVYILTIGLLFITISIIFVLLLVKGVRKLLKKVKWSFNNWNKNIKSKTN